MILFCVIPQNEQYHHHGTKNILRPICAWQTCILSFQQVYIIEFQWKHYFHSVWGWNLGEGANFHLAERLKMYFVNAFDVCTTLINYMSW